MHKLLLEERNNTISDLQYHKTIKDTRPIAALTRNISEMSIECSTAIKEPPETPTTTTHHNKPSLILDDIDGLSSSNKLLIQEKVKSVFELPDTETLVNGKVGGFFGK